ncbi:MAG: deoxyguanosinetriphosphate triphosphohydrolase [Candidatus Omnitrophica bacterium]|nr:deoxyguanosinetriphosphate triphosphohydrolase [Candidatus Omnitrophota bacterium]
MLTREMLEKYEQENLADYAMKSSQTKGRVYFEKEHDYRSVYQRDRDRIIHSTAFRRLEYKTQVFVNHEGDYYRTRLTHSIEVAQLARSISRALRLNEDLSEAIALAHDMGHTPFGHSGEEVLHKLMRRHGGFEHNAQGLRVVDKLERRYPGFSGLNLTWEVREGIIRHHTDYDWPKTKGFDPSVPPSLEAQVVNLADEIAYNNHDLDDGLTAGLITEDDLEKVKLWKRAYKKAGEKFPALDKKRRKYETIRRLINAQVTDLIVHTEKTLKRSGLKDSNSVRKMKKNVVSFSPEMEKGNKQLKIILNQLLYQHYRVVRMANKARRFIEELFNTYLRDPSQLPPSTQKRVKEDDSYRAICDYIAGMTDRFAEQEYKKLFIPYEKV